MKRKKVCVIIAVMAIVAFLLSYIISYANTSETIYVNLTKLDTNGVGYGIGNPENGTNESGQPASSAYIWNITTYDSATSTTASATQRNLYCIKANYGDSWNTNKDTIVAYNLSYDLQADRQTLLSKIVDNGKDVDDIIKTLLSETGYYRELLWILDNSYIEGQTDKIEFLSNIGIIYDSELGAYVYEPIDGYDYSSYVSGNSVMFGYNEDHLMTDADIKAVQRAVIWYYTNYLQDTTNDAVFNNKNSSADWLTITTDGSTYQQLVNYNSTTGEGSERFEQAQILYNYLIDAAANNASQYTSDNNYTITSGATVNTTGLTQNSNGKYRLSTTRVGSNYVVGPIVIDRNSSSTYGISIKVTDQNNSDISYTFTDSTGNSLGTTNIKDLVGRTGGFYITVPRNGIEKVNVKIDVTQETTKKTLWLDGTEDTDSITLNAEQPIVEVTRTQETIPTEFEAQPEEFDLALRKYITQLNGENITNTRVPNIDTATLQTGTTATYKHRKDPVVVEDKDEVTYTIAIYNEGNKAGYASKVVDQLPTGLVNSPNNSTTVVSKDKNGNTKNTYTLAYNTTLNQITLTIENTTENPAKDLNAYTSGNLDYETIEIKCKVAQEADTKNQIILTNVAWIDEAYNSEDGITITNQVGKDRDSEPDTSPSVNKDNMQNYKGNTSNQDDLSNSNYFYQGEQDDDDFEKLVIMPVEKIFDLALFKHIAAISKDQTIEAGEYVTDTGNIDGTYLRAQVVTAIDAETGKITYKEDNKEALVVEPGDYVLYTIRVYNEGEVNGYASKIKDTLPIGLEFVVENEEYNGIWNLDGLDSDGRQVVSTTWYAKGNGDDEKTPGSNLLKALNKEGAISNTEPANPDYIDAQVLCKVVEEATSDRVLVNYAQISDDSDENGDPIDDIDSTPDEWIDTDDDQDIERIKLQCFDLSLRKFITAVNGTELKNSNGKYAREPVVDVSNLVNGTDSTAVYTHPKTPVSVQVGDKVVYTIRVYNEGDINGYASEVKDYLPPYLTYLATSETNQKYGWEISGDGRIVTTTYLADKELTAFNGTTLDYEDIQIECLVSSDAPKKQNQTNIAEISEYTYNGSTVQKDIDSTSNNITTKIPTDDNLPSYKDDEISKPYVPGNEDDDDFEKIYVKEFDLALRKFITEVQEKEVTDRVPQVKIENGVISYDHPKDPITLHVDDVVIYTLRIYNEGEISGYASEITDDIPEFLEFLPDENTNIEDMWKMYDENGNETTNVDEAVKIKTTYLSKENGENNLIKAFDGTTLDYKDIKIAFRVKDPNSNTYIITNHAQISDDSDENGNDVIDKDSVPGEWNEGEDDQDIENVKVEYFDLALLKFVSKVIVIEDGKETITETGYNGHEDPEPVVKVELHKKKINEVTVKFGYGITITNEGDIPGYATEITDYVPDGLRFEAEDNPLWTDEGNNVISTKQLENTLLQPGESATIEVIFTWINGADNLSLKTNTAEISEDYNEYGVPDRDSTPDNKIDGEDDIDIAKVILAITTGSAKTYFTLTMGLLAIVVVGIVLIKKFVI